MKGTITHEINNQAQEEYFEKWQKSMEKSMKEMCEKLKAVARDGHSTCSICSGITAFGTMLITH